MELAIYFDVMLLMLLADVDHSTYMFDVYIPMLLLVFSMIIAMSNVMNHFKKGPPMFMNLEAFYHLFCTVIGHIMSSSLLHSTSTKFILLSCPIIHEGTSDRGR